MKFATGSAIFFAASIALAIASPARSYYRADSVEEDEEESAEVLAANQPYTLATAPYFYQPRSAEVGARKYKIVKKKKKNPVNPYPIEEDDEPQDDEDDDESSEEEADEEGGEDEEADEEQSMDVPPWEELFPEEDKNTGTFDDHQGGGGYGGRPGGALANLPGGAPAPESSGSLMNLFTGGSSGSSESGPQSDFGGPPPEYRQGPPPKYRQGPPSKPPKRARYQGGRGRGRSDIQSGEESQADGRAVLYDGYRYIPVRPVHIKLQQRESKKVKNSNKNQKEEGRSLQTTSRTTSSSTRRQPKNRPYVLVPVPEERDSREIRFSRDEHGLRMEHGPIYAPTEIWRWEGPGGRPLRRRENRPYYPPGPPRPQRGSSIRFHEDSDY